jgi:hypothetical protein
LKPFLEQYIQEPFLGHIFRTQTKIDSTACFQLSKQSLSLYQNSYHI